MKYQVSGRVNNAYTKTKKSKANKDFTINYIDVDGVTVSTGFNAEHTVGEQINIAVEDKFGEWQKCGVTGTGLDPVPSNAPAAKGGWSKGSGGNSKGAGFKSSTFPVEPTDGQMSIIRQNSMNRAVEILRDWMANGIITFKSEADYLKKLHEVALTITDFNSGQDIMALAHAKAASLQAVK